MTEGWAAWFERQRRVSASRWVLRAAAFGSALVTPVTLDLAGSSRSALPFVIMVLFGGVAALAPDSICPTIVVAFAVAQWLVTADEPLAWWLLVVAGALVVHHASTALMSVMPEAADLPRAAAVAWLRRVGVLVVTAVAVWLLVVALDRREIPGSPALTAATFVTLVAAGFGLVYGGRPSPDR